MHFCITHAICERTNRSKFLLTFINRWPWRESNWLKKIYKNGNAILCFISKPNWSFGQFERYPTVMLCIFREKKYVYIFRNIFLYASKNIEEDTLLNIATYQLLSYSTQRSKQEFYSNRRYICNSSCVPAKVPLISHVQY